MKLPTRVRYGTKALLELAQHWNKAPVPLKDIARRQEIPLSYLEHLISPLVRGGIVKSIRGSRGGITLLKPPENIILSEVIPLLEGSLSPSRCTDRADTCPNTPRCVTQDLWDEVKEAINKVFESITLQDLADRQSRRVNADTNITAEV